MLTWLGIIMIGCFMYLIMSKRLSALTALTIIPILFAVLAAFLGHYIDDLNHIQFDALGSMMLDGIQKLAPTGIMLLFAIMYFALMIDTGLFDPPVQWILDRVHGDPLKVTLGTVLLTLIVSLDGDGSTTYMICVAAMLPLFKRLNMNPLIMTCLMLLSSGIMNLTPWGGPTARAASALHVDPSEIFVAMLIPMGISILWVFILAYAYGRYERKRLGIIQLKQPEHQVEITVSQNQEARRTHLRTINAILTLCLMISLVMGFLPMPILFMIAFSIALCINYPSLEQQKARIAEHADSALAVVSLIFAAGIFTGILSGTGMIHAMSEQFVHSMPEFLGPYSAPVTAIVSMPLTFFMSNDAFYYGMLPILSEAATHYGVTPVEMARASIIGQPVHLLSPLVPSTYLLCGLAGVDFADHQRFTLKWAIATCFVLLLSALLFGIIPFAVS